MCRVYQLTDVDPPAFRLPCRHTTDIMIHTGHARAVSSAVRAPRSHRGGRRFKSSIAHHTDRSGTQNGNHLAEVAKRQTRCVQGAVSFRTCGFKSLPRHQFPTRACSSVDRALPCGGRGREFESRQARHFFCPRTAAPGRLAQMVRASALHAEGRGFESLTAHHMPYRPATSGLCNLAPRATLAGAARFDPYIPFCLNAAGMAGP